MAEDSITYLNSFEECHLQPNRSQLAKLARDTLFIKFKGAQTGKWTNASQRSNLVISN